jgi:general secretion pathway protein A
LTGPSSPSRDELVYESFYGLAQPPFTLSPDPRFLYLSESHDAAMRPILQSIRRRERFIVLSGDIGTGKTTLCRSLVQRLDKTTFSSVVLNPFLSVEDLLRQILVDFGVVSQEGARGERFASAARGELTGALAGFLESLVPIDGRAVLVLDEAQHLSPRVLEELRVISGLERDDAAPLQIVLVGQPTLLEVLAAADLRQLDQRISLKAELQPLGRGDVEQYIAHRLMVAGESVSVVFERAAIKRVHALSGGIPRVINLLCDRALMAGAERGVYEITPALVDRAADALSFRRRPGDLTRLRSRRFPLWAAIVAAAAALLLVAVLLVALDAMLEDPPPELPAAPPADVPAIVLPAIPATLPPALRPQTPRAGGPGETPDDVVVPRQQ